ncbi:Lactonase, 7-bladed beta-propeller domain-containing protein [Trichoderma austrokoningii]
MSRRLLIARPGHIYLATYTAASITIDLDLPVAGNPSWFAVSPTNPNLVYTVDENAATTLLYRLDLAANTLTNVVERDGSTGVCHLGLSKDGSIMIGSSWAVGTMDVWDTRNGSLQLVKTMQSKDAVLDAGRVARAHQAVLDPTGCFFIVNDLGTDSLLVLDATAADVPIVNRVRVPDGSGPRHGVFCSSGGATYYMLLCEKSNRVVVFAVEYTDGGIEFTTTGSYSTFMLPEGTDGAAAGEIALSQDGKHVYTSNRLTASPTETIAHFRVLQGEDGVSLELVGETSTGGKHPRMFSISRLGDELFVGNQEGEWAVVVLKRRRDGTLEEKPVAGIRMDELVRPGGDERGPMFVMEL